MAKISWRRIAKHIKGISITVGPVGGGITLNKPTFEVDEAEKLLSYLENRRVLYNDRMIESGGPVEWSVQEIRDYLEQLLLQREIARDSDLAAIARDMQAACRTFLDAAQQRSSRSSAPRPNARWFTALEAFRAQLGPCIARLAVKYHLNVEGELVSILALGAPADHKGPPPDDSR